MRSTDILIGVLSILLIIYFIIAIKRGSRINQLITDERELATHNTVLKTEIDNLKRQVRDWKYRYTETNRLLKTYRQDKITDSVKAHDAVQHEYVSGSKDVTLRQAGLGVSAREESVTPPEVSAKIHDGSFFDRNELMFSPPASGDN